MRRKILANGALAPKRKAASKAFRRPADRFIVFSCQLSVVSNEGRISYWGLHADKLPREGFTRLGEERPGSPGSDGASPYQSTVALRTVSAYGLLIIDALVSFLQLATEN